MVVVSAYIRVFRASGMCVCVNIYICMRVHVCVCVYLCTCRTRALKHLFFVKLIVLYKNSLFL